MEQKQRFSLRKYKVGLASVLLGTVFLGGAVSSEVVYASEGVEEISQTSMEDSSASETETSGAENADVTKENRAVLDETAIAAAPASTEKTTVETKNLENKTPQEKNKIEVRDSTTLSNDKDYYEAAKFEADKVVEYKNVKTANAQGTQYRYVDLSSDISKVDQLKNATIYMEFKTTNNDGLISLFSASTNKKNNTYLTVAVNGKTPIIEGKNENDQFYDNYNAAPITIDRTKWNSIALTVERPNPSSNAGKVSLYVNGVLSKASTRSGRFIGDIEELTHMQLGAVLRGTSGRRWGADIDFRNVSIYNRALSAEEVAERSKFIPYVDRIKDVIDEDGQVLTEKKEVFTRALYPEALGARGVYRIPALLKTIDGTLIAGADERPSTGDFGDIGMVIRRSSDNGTTWNEKSTIFNIRNSPKAQQLNQPALIDMALVQDPHDKKIYAFYDLFPEGRGLVNPPQGSPELISINAETKKAYKNVDGKNYQLIYKGDEEFTIRENGEVFDANNSKTNYRVTLNPESTNAYETYGDIHDGTRRIGNIYFRKDSEFKVAYTSYIMVSESSDDGKTWSAPRNISDMVRKDDMTFQGIGPGAGIVLKEGTKAGRIIIPTYTTNAEGRKQESARIIYSDDHGKTWQTSDIIYGRSGNSEATVVELKNGHLKMFMRNSSNRVHMATSTDGGTTWNSAVEVLNNIPEEGTQMSAITTNKDGKQYVILSSGGPQKRNIGNLYVAEVKDNGQLEWVAKNIIQKGVYGYSSLQELGNDEFGILFEHGGDTNYPHEIYYKKMNWEFLKPKDIAPEVIKVNSTSLTSEDDTIALTYSNSIVPSDDLVLQLANGRSLPLIAQYNNNTLLFKWDKTQDQGVEITGIKAGTLNGLEGLEGLAPYTVNEKAYLPYDLEKKETEEVLDFATTYERDDELNAGEERSEGGVVGRKTTTKTYVVNSEGKVVETTTVTTVDAVDKVVYKGTKPKVTKVETELPTRYEGDEEKDTAYLNEVAGTPKVETTTIRYTVDPATGVVTEATTKEETQGVAKVVTKGTKTKVTKVETELPTRYEGDEAQDTTYLNEVEGRPTVETTATRYTVDQVTGVVTETVLKETTQGIPKVITKGTKPKEVEEEQPTIYESDDNMEYGQEISTPPSPKITRTTYEVDENTGNVTSTDEVILNGAPTYITKGTKPTVTTEYANEIENTYVANENKPHSYREIIVRGIPAETTTTTTYTMDKVTGNITSSSISQTTPGTKNTVEIGTLPTVERENKAALAPKYEADPNAELRSITPVSEGTAGYIDRKTTYKVDANTGEVTVDKVEVIQEADSTRGIIYVGTKPTEIEEATTTTKYQAFPTMHYGERQELAGSPKITRITYNLDENTGEVTANAPVVIREASPRTVIVGTEPTFEQENVEVVYEADETREYESERIVKDEGEAKVIKTTYEVDENTGKITETKSVTAQGRPKVVSVGTKAKEIEETLRSIYRGDDEVEYNAFGTPIPGTPKITKTSYRLDTKTGEVTSSEEVMDSGSAEVIIKGTKPILVPTELIQPTYRGDETQEIGYEITIKGRPYVEKTTYTVDETTGEYSSKKEVADEGVRDVVVKGIKPTSITRPTVNEVRYEADVTRDYGDDYEAVEGVPGELTITTTYNVDKDTGEIIPVNETAVRTKEPITRVIKVGTKPKEVTTTVNFTEEVRNNPLLAKGQTRLVQEGESGVTKEKTTYTLNSETGDIVTNVAHEVVTELKNKITEVGTFESSVPAVAPSEEALPEYPLDQVPPYSQMPAVAPTQEDLPEYPVDQVPPYSQVPETAPVQEGLPEYPIDQVPPYSKVPETAPVQEDLPEYPVDQVPPYSAVPEVAPIQEALPEYPLDQVPPYSQVTEVAPTQEVSEKTVSVSNITSEVSGKSKNLPSTGEKGASLSFLLTGASTLSLLGLAKLSKREEK